MLRRLLASARSGVVKNFRWASQTLWYEKHGRFSIGAQFGGPDVGDIPALKRELCELLNKHCSSTESSDVDHFAFALRVNGPISNFGETGIDRVRHQAKDRYIGADIVLAQESVSVPVSDVREQMAELVREAITACIQRLEKKRVAVDTPKLMTNVNNALAIFSGSAK